MVTHDPREALLTADRILLLGGTPTGVLRSVDVPLPVEREYSSRQVAELEAYILGILSDDSPESRR